MLSGDLTQTAEVALAEGEEGLREVGFELFRPILPMLASTADGVPDAMASFERASVEWKLDGIRIQIHRRGDEVRVYTRNLNEITDTLPGIVRAVRALPVKQAVLDGEALWMTRRGRRTSSTPSTSTATTCSTRRSRSARPGWRRSPRSCGFRVSLTFGPRAAERVLEEALEAGNEGIIVKDAARSTAPAGAARRGARTVAMFFFFFFFFF